MRLITGQLTNRFATVLLLGILCIGTFVRVYKITEVPNGFFADEASIGFDAYTLLTTGKDAYGETLPVFFQSLGEYKAPIGIYATIPFISLLGLNETSVRLSAAFFGIATLLLVYFLGKTLLSKTDGLWALFFAATMPWLIHYDRSALLINIYTTFYVLSLLLFFQSVKKRVLLIPAYITFGLTFYTNQPAKLLVPLTLLGLVFLYRRVFIHRKKELIIGTLLFLIVSIPLIMSMVSGEGLKRFHQVSIFKDNKPLDHVILQATQQYFIQFSTTYLIIKGDDSFNLRHFSKGLTPLLPVTYVFFVLGVAVCITYWKEKKYLAMLFLLVIYPIAGAFVDEPPFSSRSIIGAPIFALFMAVGVTWSLSLMKRLINNRGIQRGFVLLLVLICFMNFLTFARFYFSVYPKYSSGYWGWQYGYRETVSYLKQQEARFDEAIITHRFNDGEWLLRFYNVVFQCQTCSILPNPIVIDASRRQLFALRSDDIQEAKQLYPSYSFQTQKVISAPGGEAQIYIGIFIPPLASAGKMY